MFLIFNFQFRRPLLRAAAESTGEHRMGVAGANRVRQQRIRIHCLVILDHLEVQMGSSMCGVAGVADVSEKIAGVDAQALIDAGSPAVEVRVVKRQPRLGDQPQAAAALALLADVADVAVCDRNNFRPSRCKDVDAAMSSPSAVCCS